MDTYRDKLTKPRDIDLNSPAEEKLKKEIEEKDKEIKKLKTKAKKSKSAEDRLYTAFRKSEDALAEATRKQDEILASKKYPPIPAYYRSVEDAPTPVSLQSIREDMARRSEAARRADGSGKPKSDGILHYELSGSLVGALAGLAISICVIWLMVSLVLGFRDKIEKNRDTLDVSITYYETIKEWTTEIPSLSKYVKDARRDGKITSNEYYEIRDKKNELEKEKVAKEAIGDSDE